MAPETYYFFFSILAALTPSIYTANMVYYRLKGKNIIGRKYKPGTADYEIMHKQSSNRGLAILGTITLAGFVNLGYNIYRLLNLPDQDYAHFILWFAPLFIAVITIPVVIMINRQYGNGKYEQLTRKNSKKKKDN